jgi:hypothetical protein
MILEGAGGLPPQRWSSPWPQAVPPFQRTRPPKATRAAFAALRASCGKSAKRPVSRRRTDRASPSATWSSTTRPGGRPTSSAHRPPHRPFHRRQDRKPPRRGHDTAKNAKRPLHAGAAAAISRNRSSRPSRDLPRSLRWRSPRATETPRPSQGHLLSAPDPWCDLVSIADNAILTKFASKRKGRRGKGRAALPCKNHECQINTLNRQRFRQSNHDSARVTVLWPTRIPRTGRRPGRRDRLQTERSPERQPASRRTSGIPAHWLRAFPEA